MKNISILTKSEIDLLDEVRFVHPFNEKAIRNTKSISDLTGLNDIGIHLVRVEPNDETTQHHYHDRSDEFVYILSGTATLELGNESFTLSKGDFVGFPANGEAHSMKNTGTSDLVYLMGGNRLDTDCCNYPRIKKRTFRINGRSEYVDMNDLTKL